MWLLGLSRAPGSTQDSADTPRRQSSMNAYTTTGPARIRQRDVANILSASTGSHMAGGVPGRARAAARLSGRSGGALAAEAEPRRVACQRGARGDAAADHRDDARSRRARPDGCARERFLASNGRRCRKAGQSSSVSVNAAFVDRADCRMRVGGTSREGSVSSSQQAGLRNVVLQSCCSARPMM